MRLVTRLAAGVAAATMVLTLGIGSAANASTSMRRAPMTGATISTTKYAGYEASGRDFRYGQATLTIPDHVAQSYYPMAYVSLKGNDSQAAVGVVSYDTAVSLGYTGVDPAGGWLVFAGTDGNTLGSGLVGTFLPITGVQPGDGITVSVYSANGEDHFVITPPSTDNLGNGFGVPVYVKGDNYGAVYNEALAVNDWTYTSGPHTLFTPVTVDTFLGGAFTTGNGQRGSFTGPWTTSAVQATSNGQPFPAGTVRALPSALTSDGITANGAVRQYDSFSVTVN